MRMNGLSGLGGRAIIGKGRGSRYEATCDQFIWSAALESPAEAEARFAVTAFNGIDAAAVLAAYALGRLCGMKDAWPQQPVGSGGRGSVVVTDAAFRQGRSPES